LCSLKGQHGESGFTLIELIVVCTLIGIMLTMGIPSLRNTVYTDPLKSSARKVIGFVGGLRESAVRYQQPYLLYISQSENRIWYEKDLDANTGEDIEREKNESDDHHGKHQLQFPETVRISEVQTQEDDASAQDGTVIWISKQGYLARTIIQLEDEDGNVLNVQFYPFLDSATVSGQDNLIEN